MLILTQLWANKFIRWTIIIVIVLVIMYLVGRAAGLRKAEKDQTKLPNNGKGIPTGWDPKPLASEFYKNFKGIWTWAAQKEVTLGKLFNLTDDQLVAVYNAFNRYFSDDGNSMTKWIRGEFNVTVGGIADSVIEKLVRLNCL